MLHFNSCFLLYFYHYGIPCKVIRYNRPLGNFIVNHKVAWSPFKVLKNTNYYPFSRSFYPCAIGLFCKIYSASVNKILPGGNCKSWLLSMTESSLKLLLLNFLYNSFNVELYRLKCVAILLSLNNKNLIVSIHSKSLILSIIV